MAYENIKFTKPNMAICNGYFYMLDETRDLLVQKTAGGTNAFRYPVNIPTEFISYSGQLGEVKSLKFDGISFWSLQVFSNNSGLLVRRWLIENFLCNLIAQFPLLNNNDFTFLSSALAVEQYGTTTVYDIPAGTSQLTLNEYTDSVVYPATVLALGPNKYDQKEFVSVQTISGTSLILNQATKYYYYAEDPVTITPSFYIFNEYDHKSSSTGALLSFDTASGTCIVSNITGVEYKGIESAKFCRFQEVFFDNPDIHSLVFVNGTSARFRDMSDLTRYKAYLVADDNFSGADYSMPDTAKWSVTSGDPIIKNNSLFCSTTVVGNDEIRSKYNIAGGNFEVTVSGYFGGYSIVSGTYNRYALPYLSLTNSGTTCTIGPEERWDIIINEFSGNVLRVNSVSGTYTTITAAHTAATAGDIILIDPGTYLNENLIVTKHVHLLGNTSDLDINPVIISSTTSSYTLEYGQSGSTSWCNNIKTLHIENIDFRQTNAWSRALQFSTITTNLTINVTKCKFTPMNSNVYPMGYWDYGAGTLNVNYCTIAKGYAHVVYFNSTTYNLNKVELQGGAFYAYLSNASPSINDSVTTTTSGYGYKYGASNIIPPTSDRTLQTSRFAVRKNNTVMAQAVISSGVANNNFYLKAKRYNNNLYLYYKQKLVDNYTLLYSYSDFVGSLYFSLGLVSEMVTASGVYFDDVTFSTESYITFPSTTSKYYGILGMDNIKTNQSTVIPIYDIDILGDDLYRLQSLATYYGSDITWTTYNFQISPIRSFLDFITLDSDYHIIPATGRNTIALYAVVLDQYGEGVLSKPVIFSDDDPVGFVTSTDVYTDSYYGNGLAKSTYMSGTDLRVVTITSTATQYD